MVQYIDKAEVKAELERRKNQFVSQAESFREIGMEDKENYFAALASNMNSLSSFIDTLEVKEVDLEKEIQQHINDCLDIKFPTTDIKAIAKDVEFTARKFFELGLKAQKGE